MESPFIDSLSSSPDVATMPMPSPAFYDLNSDSSSPNSPMQNGRSILFPVTSSSYNNALLYQSAPSEFCTSPLTEKMMPLPTNAAERQNRRRKSSAVKDPEMIANMQFRRRAQNRASQRAFRERKERHLKMVESQLQNLQALHHDLLQSYHQQAQEVSRLKQRIQELMVEINKFRTAETTHTNDHQLCAFDHLPATFDMVPYPPSLSYVTAGQDSCLRIDTESKFLQGDSNDSL